MILRSNGKRLFQNRVFSLLGRISFLLVLFLSVVIFPGPANLTNAQNAGDLLETMKEQIAAQDAELAPRKFEYRPDKSSKKKAQFPLPLGTTKPLFAGVDDITVPAFFIDPADASTTQAFVGFEVWGAAYDAVNDRVLFNNGATLMQRAADGTVTEVGQIVNGDGATQVMVALAWHDGVLYGTKNISTEAVWQINTETMVATIAITYPTTHDMGGLAVDPNTGFIYATDDSTTTGSRALVRINADGTVTAIAPYPEGQTDIDALAIDGDGHAYLVPDQPGEIFVYDLVGGTYLTPFANPWTSSEVFSGAAWVGGSAPSVPVSVSGRVLTPSGSPIRNTIVTITDGAAFSASARTGSFGYFSFDGVLTGTTYTITGQAKGHTFTPLEVPVSSEVTGLVLTSSGKP